jgi:hypothetical protein
VNSGAARREAREKLLEAARRREIDVVLVWRLDRGGRSVTDLLATLQELEHLGVGFVYLTEALGLATPAGGRTAGIENFHRPSAGQRDANQGHSLLRAALRRDIRGYERRSDQTVPRASQTTTASAMVRHHQGSHFHARGCRLGRHRSELSPKQVK